LKKLATLLAIGTSLALPAGALAKTFDHEGQIVGDKATRVTLGVKVEKGDPKKITDFKAREVMTRCGKDREPARITFTLLTALRVRGGNEFRARLSDGEGGSLRISGEVRKGGRITEGRLRTSEFRSHSGSTKGQLCRTPRQRFRTSAG